MKKIGLGFLSLLIAGVLLGGPQWLAPQTAAFADNDSSSQVIEEQSYMLAPGVSHSSKKLNLYDSLQSLQVLEIDTQNPNIDLKVLSLHNEVFGRESVGDMLQEQEAMGHPVAAAVNGDFFTAVGVPSGLQISDGEIIISPSTIKTLLMVLPNGRVKLEHSVTMNATISKPGGESLVLDSINRSQAAAHTNHAFLFNSRFGESTNVPAGGVEVVIEGKNHDGQLKAGRRLVGSVVSIRPANNSELLPDQLILSATGEKAEWVRQNLAVGETVHMDVSFDKGVNDAVQVISGNSTLGKVLLLDGEIPAEILDPADSLNTSREPRTMLGTKDGKLFIVVVDGRQPGHSNGLTLAEGAKYLKSLGADQAINLDGGGSSTYYARQPGDELPTLLNRPSDGIERTVANSIMVLPKKSDKKLENIVIRPEAPILAAPGSKVKLEAKGLDRYYNPVPIDELEWSVAGPSGQIDSQGYLTAGPTTGTVAVTARSGKISASAEVTVTDQIDRIKLTPRDFVLENGASMKMTASAYAADGRRIALSNDQIDWSADPSIGTINEEGVFTAAASGNSSGTITGKYGTFTFQAVVQIGVSPVIESFESGARITASEVRTVPGSTTVTLVGPPAPVRFGQYAAKFTTDFTGTTGTSGAYINFLDDRGQLGRPVPGKPERLGVWVYGDKTMHHLRLGITDGNKANKLWNFTAIGGLNWSGWRYVELQVPVGTVFPIKIRNIALEESSVGNKTSSTLYFDNFTAVYTPKE
ncbi:phosphodiester glycosidase family protein [Paenibacillus sp. HJGM_3]|uniref:phosphodiester glycosidase family protein n=1 Tax=Paenibacillus sp. HJGM_3 TaxID=3379816 RepID=UPI003858788E